MIWALSSNLIKVASNYTWLFLFPSPLIIRCVRPWLSSKLKGWWCVTLLPVELTNEMREGEALIKTHTSLFLSSITCVYFSPSLSLYFIKFSLSPVMSLSCIVSIRLWLHFCMPWKTLLHVHFNEFFRWHVQKRLSISHI